MLMAWGLACGMQVDISFTISKSRFQIGTDWGWLPCARLRAYLSLGMLVMKQEKRRIISLLDASISMETALSCDLNFLEQGRRCHGVTYSAG